MTKRIFRSIFLVALAVLLVAMTLVLGAVYAHSSQNQTQQLRIGTELAAEALANEGAEYLANLQDFSHCRITWIDGSGTVLFDNRQEPGALTSHLQRQEVADALKTGYGESVRYSDTLLQRSVYAARRLPDGTVLRLSTTQASALRLVLDMWEYILLIFAAIGGLSFFWPGGCPKTWCSL